jgi:lysozyme family protein
MKENFDTALEHVLVHEGGYSDHPADPGGATMKGVTLAVFRRFFGAKKTKKDLRNITDAQLAKVYRAGYWDKCQCDKLPSGVDYAVFDAAVNSGPGRGAKWLQGAVGAFQDGGIGPDTLEKVAARSPKAVINDMLDRRLAFLKSLATWGTFGRGWGRRVDGVRATALQMAGEDVAEQTVTPDVSFDIVRRGSKGAWVVKLQTALDITVDGDFGTCTEDALKAFQKENDLEPDGVAGRNTYRALGLIA